jgi:tetratricopeptide (TPR) repeat protein
MYEFLKRVHPAASQDFSVGGRIAWAIHCYDAAWDAWEKGDLATAVVTLREGIYAFPFPKSLELLGECLLQEGNLVEATIYLAAAVGMSEEEEFRTLFLLGKALATANDNYVSKIMLEKAISIKPDTEAQELLRHVQSRSTPEDQAA